MEYKCCRNPILLVLRTREVFSFISKVILHCDLADTLWEADFQLTISRSKKLKYVPKYIAHFVKTFDNFVILQPIVVFSSKMKSMGNEDNFQNNFIKLMEIYSG